jgi:hypothetical protein
MAVSPEKRSDQMKKVILLSMLVLGMTACVENPPRHDNHRVHTWCENHPLECRDHNRNDRDNDPPGSRGGPGTNWENPRGPIGGPGASPDIRHPRRW